MTEQPLDETGEGDYFPEHLDPSAPMEIPLEEEPEATP